MGYELLVDSAKEILVGQHTTKTNGDAYLVSLTTHYHDVVIGGTIGCNDSSYGEESSGTGAYYINDRWGYDFNVA